MDDVFIPDFYLKEGKEDWKEKYEKVVMCVPVVMCYGPTFPFSFHFVCSLTFASVQNLSERGELAVLMRNTSTHTNFCYVPALFL